MGRPCLSAGRGSLNLKLSFRATTKTFTPLRLLRLLRLLRATMCYLRRKLKPRSRRPPGASDRGRPARTECIKTSPGGMNMPLGSTCWEPSADDRSLPDFSPELYLSLSLSLSLALDISIYIYGYSRYSILKRYLSFTHVTSGQTWRKLCVCDVEAMKRWNSQRYFCVYICRHISLSIHGRGIYDPGSRFADPPPPMVSPPPPTPSPSRVCVTAHTFCTGGPQNRHLSRGSRPKDARSV